MDRAAYGRLMRWIGLAMTAAGVASWLLGYRVIPALISSGSVEVRDGTAESVGAAGVDVLWLALLGLTLFGASYLTGRSDCAEQWILRFVGWTLTSASLALVFGGLRDPSSLSPWVLVPVSLGLGLIWLSVRKRAEDSIPVDAGHPR